MLMLGHRGGNRTHTQKRECGAGAPAEDPAEGGAGSRHLASLFHIQYNKTEQAFLQRNPNQPDTWHMVSLCKLPVLYQVLCIPFTIFAPCLSVSLSSVIQIRGHIAGSSPPSPLASVRASHFYGEKTSAFFLVSSTRSQLLVQTIRRLIVSQLKRVSMKDGSPQMPQAGRPRRRSFL